MNKIQLIGNLGSDPDMSYTTNGKAVTRFSIAVNKWGKDAKGEATTVPTWFNIVAWDKLAEICNDHLKKGAKIWVDGTLVVRDYNKEGVKRTAVEVVIKDMEMLSSKKSSDEGVKYDSLGDLEDHPF